MRTAQTLRSFTERWQAAEQVRRRVSKRARGTQFTQYRCNDGLPNNTQVNYTLGTCGTSTPTATATSTGTPTATSGDVDINTDGDIDVNINADGNIDADRITDVDIDADQYTDGIADGYVNFDADGNRDGHTHTGSGYRCSLLRPFITGTNHRMSR